MHTVECAQCEKPLADSMAGGAECGGNTKLGVIDSVW